MTEHITVSRELLHSIQDAVIRLKPFVGGLGNSVLREIEAGVASALEQPPQKPELRVGQIWRTRGGAVAEIVSETENSPRPFVCGFPGQARCKLTVTKNGTCYESAQHPSDLFELISDVPQERR